MHQSASWESSSVLLDCGFIGLLLLRLSFPTDFFLLPVHAPTTERVSSPSQATTMASLFHRRHQQDESKAQESRGWFAGDSSSSSDEESRADAAATAERKEARRTRRGSRKAVRVYTKANPNYSVTVRNNQVVLAPDQSNSDEKQVWIKDEAWGNKVQDDGGNPAFALVNRATGLALQHAKHESEQVRLVEYDPNNLDESLLWTLSDDLGGGYHAVRKASDTSLNLDAWKADADSGGVHDGTVLTLYKWNKGANQLWKIDNL